MNHLDNATAAQAESAVRIGVTVNGVAQSLPMMTLAQWVASTGAAPGALATALNGEFVARDARAQRMLREGDAIMSFQPIQGG